MIKAGGFLQSVSHRKVGNALLQFTATQTWSADKCRLLLME